MDTWLMWENTALLFSGFFAHLHVPAYRQAGQAGYFFIASSFLTSRKDYEHVLYFVSFDLVRLLRFHSV